MKKLRILFLSLFMTVFSSQAFSAIIDLNDLADENGIVDVIEVTSYNNVLSDFLNFTLFEDSKIGITLSTPNSNIVFDHIILYDSLNNNVSSSPSTEFAGLSILQNDADGMELAAGDYSFYVHGSIAQQTGSYNITMTGIAPVPEPSTYALMLAGLGLVGFMARRRV